MVWVRGGMGWVSKKMELGEWEDGSQDIGRH